MLILCKWRKGITLPVSSADSEHRRQTGPAAAAAAASLRKLAASQEPEEPVTVASLPLGGAANQRRVPGQADRPGATGAREQAPLGILHRQSSVRVWWALLAGPHRPEFSWHLQEGPSP